MSLNKLSDSKTKQLQLNPNVNTVTANVGKYRDLEADNLQVEVMAVGDLAVTTFEVSGVSTLSSLTADTINSNGTLNVFGVSALSQVHVNDTTQSTSKASGALIVAGGIGVDKDIYCQDLRTFGGITADGGIIAEGNGVDTPSLVSNTSASGSTAIRGTQIADDAIAGFVGEYSESKVSDIVYPATTTWGDATSILLEKGDWDIQIQGLTTRDALTTEFEMGISATAGNSFPDLAFGDTMMFLQFTTPATNSSISVAPLNLSVRRSFASDTTFHLKYRSVYTGAVPHFWGKISCRRSR